LNKNTAQIDRRGLMLVLSSPSGAGKTTLSRMLLEVESGLEMSVSVTTRPMRPGEVDGEDYIFVAQEDFNAMRDEGELLEWAVVFDNFYGTPKGPIEKALGEGRDVLFDIDWQGAESLTNTAEDDLVTVFICRHPRKRLKPGSLTAHRIQLKLSPGVWPGLPMKSSIGTSTTTL
jgi:guanylate kinase